MTSPAHRPGPPSRSRASLLLTVRSPEPVARPVLARLVAFGIIGAAAVAVVAGLLTAPISSASATDLGRTAVAVVVVALALIAVVRVRVNRGYISLGWGEAAVIVALYLVPVGWVPLATLLGAASAMVVVQFTQEARTAVRILANASSIAVGSSVAGVVADVIASPYLARLTLPMALGLVLGALCYTGITVAMACASLSARTGTSFLDLVRRATHGKLVMLVGNVPLGLLIMVILRDNLGWLVVLLPVLWLLRQGYAYRLRLDDERRSWRQFADVTRGLNRLEERDVVRTAIDGAGRLFAATGVEVVILRPDGPRPQVGAGPDGVEPDTGADAREAGAGVGVGPADAQPPPDRWRVYRGAPGEDLEIAPLDERWPGSGRVGAPEGQSARGQPLAGRPLMVGGVLVGELRVHFAQPVRLTRLEQMQLSAFGDALAAALHDATSHRELRELTARSFRDARHDALTGVGNRAALLAEGEAALRGLAEDALVAFLLLDINQFKEINDTLGHAAGDDLLRVAASRIDAARGPGELVARLGGDEFGVLLTALPGVAGDEAAATEQGLRRARELTDLLAAPTRVAGVPVVVEAAVGVAMAAAGGCDMGELVRRAELAMYRAKHGGVPVAWYDSAGDATSTDRLALLAELREALGSTEQLVLALQPVVDLAGGGPAGVEALIRWRHPRRGELAPEEFIDVLESSELVGPFTRYVLERAVGLAAGWVAGGLTVPISVNLSARSLLDPRLPETIAAILQRYGLPANLLTLEITETVAVPESRTAAEVLDRLRGIGVQLAVDDFGTGYSSLTFLARVRVDEVKVDRSFVARMVDSPEAMAIVRTTVDLARRLNLRVVAEGVETAEQRSELIRLGCHAAQGYHFFRPMPAEKIGGVLHQLARSAAGRVIPLRQEDAS